MMDLGLFSGSKLRTKLDTINNNDFKGDYIKTQILMYQFLMIYNKSNKK